MQTAEPKTPHEPEGVQDAFATNNFYWFHLLYNGMANTVGGYVRLAPASKRGRVVWRDVTREALTTTGQISSIEEAHRLCVLVNDIEGCDPSTEVVVFFAEHSGENPFVRQIAGPAEDSDIAALIVYRKMGYKPRMSPVLPVQRELPAPSNDNLPGVAPPPMHPDPFSPDAAGGLLGDIARWITSTAIIPAPELSLMAAASLIAGLFGKKCLGPTGAGINLYVTTLLATAGGKGHPPKAIRTLAEAVGGTGAVTNGDPTSYAAIERMLRKNTSTVITMDEFGITLQDVNAKNRNSVASSIRKFLLAVYDQANSSFDGRIYASSDTKKDDGPIVGPALTVLAMSTIDTLFAGLSEASISDGFLNRFLFVTAQASTEPLAPPKLQRVSKPSASLVEALRKAVTDFPRSASGNLAKFSVPIEGGEDGAAYKRWSEVFLWQHHSAWQEAERNINGRAAENTIRLATVRAIGRKPQCPEITVDDIEWAWAIVFRSIDLLSAGIKQHMSDSPAEALRKSIVTAIREAKDQKLPFAFLLQRKGVKGSDLREVEGALQWLIEAGQVTDTASRVRPGRGSSFKLNDVVVA